MKRYYIDGTLKKSHNMRNNFPLIHKFLDGGVGVWTMSLS